MNIKKPVNKAFLCFLLVIAIYLSLHLFHLKDWYEKKDLYFLDGNPVMSTYDAYYFLRLVEDYQEGKYKEPIDTLRNAPRPSPPPLIVSITAYLHILTGTSIEKIAFFLPPLLGSLSLFIYFHWGKMFNSYPLFVFSSILGSTASFWFARIRWGWFDTDSLNLFFLFLVGFTVSKVTGTQPFKKKILWLLPLFFTLLLWHWWWPQGHNVGILLAFSTYAISIIFTKNTKLEKYIKIAMMILGCLCLLMAYFHLAPRSLGSLTGYLDLILKSEESASMLAVGSSISELQAPTWFQFVEGTLNSSLLLVVSLGGLILTIRERKSVAITYMPFIMLGLLTFFSKRFLIYTVPPLAFSALYVPFFLLRKADLFTLKEWRKTCLFLILAGVMVYPNIQDNIKTSFLPKINSNLVKLALFIPPGDYSSDTVWAWWDYGYILQYYTKKKTFFDGGSQDKERMLLGAYPFSVEDPESARNWINCFAAGGLNILVRARQLLGDEVKTWHFLREALSKPQHIESIATYYHQEKNLTLWKELLYPAKRFLVYIPADFFAKAYWWYYYGTWDHNTFQGYHAFSSFIPRWFVDINSSKGYARTLKGETINFERLISLNSTNRPEEIVIAGKNDTQDGNVIFLTFPNELLVVEKRLFNSMAFKLYTNPDGFKDTFELIHYDPSMGGVWRTKTLYESQNPSSSKP